MHRYEQYGDDRRWGRVGASLRVQLSVYARRPRPRPPERRFLIFAQGRSGSTLLGSLLGSHPDISCDHEILSIPVLFPMHYVQRRAQLSRKDTYGFRVKIYQLTSIQKIKAPRRFVAKLHRSGYKIIHLRRANLLRQAVSNLVAAASDRYHYTRSDRDPAAAASIDVDCGELVSMIRKRVRYADDEDRVLAGLPAHRMIYERHLLHRSAHQRALDDVFAFLGVPSLPVRSDLVRSVSGRLEDVVRNYAELEKALREAGFERFLHDERYAGSAT